MLFSRKDARIPEALDRRNAMRLDKVFRVYLETRAPQPIGSQVRITFPADSGEMSAVAEVRYVCHLLGRTPVAERGPLALRGMGVRFLYFEADDVAPAEVH